MQPSDENLEAFRAWMVRRGRVAGTADLYVKNVRSCAAERDGLVARLVAGKLAPKTLHTNRAALAAWAIFAKDLELQHQLKDLLLPPAKRIRTRDPLSEDDWRSTIEHIKVCSLPNEALRSVLLIIAVRGLRCIDVLRISRSAVIAALETGRLIYEGKGRKRIEIDARPLRAQLEVFAAHQKWNQVRDLVSPANGVTAAYKRVWRAAKRTAREVGVTAMHPHRFRHTFATRFLDRFKGDPNALNKLKDFMGWESIATASLYVDHINRDELEMVGADLVSSMLRAKAPSEVGARVRSARGRAR